MLHRNFYKRREWLALSHRMRIASNFTCERCGRQVFGRELHVHHRKPSYQTPALALEPLNLIVLCRDCHSAEHGTLHIRKIEPRPELPKPNCRVMLVCGPPGAGKSTYVRDHAAPGDIVIDLDTIAKEHGIGRNRPQDKFAFLLGERNRRLAALAHAPAHRTAWVILAAPSDRLRRWWCSNLSVKPADLVVLKPSRKELHRRIMADPDRIDVVGMHVAVIDKWLKRERTNDAGSMRSPCTIDGTPTDPLHPWNAPGGQR